MAVVSQDRLHCTVPVSLWPLGRVCTPLWLRRQRSCHQTPLDTDRPEMADSASAAGPICWGGKNIHVL